MKKLMIAVCLLILLACPARVHAAAGLSVELLSGKECDYGLNIPFTRSPRTKDYTFEVYPGASAAGSPMVQARVTITAAGQVTVHLPCAVDPAGPADYTLKVTAHVAPGRAGLDREGTLSKTFTTAPTCGCAAGTAGAFYAGNGTMQSPYRVSTPAQLQHLNRHLDAGLCFLQINDIDLTGYDSDGNAANGNWTPIGISSALFSGTYDGGGYTVSHATCSLTQNYPGLFGRNSGTIQNLGVTDSSFYTSRDNGGVLCGLSTGSIDRCYAQNSSITVGGLTAGGLVGYYSGGQKVSDCYTISCTANNSGSFSGGLVGAIDSGSILRCYSLGSTVSGPASGGLIGGVQPNSGGTASISGCYWQSASASHAFGLSNAGGLDAGCVQLAASGFATASNLPALSIGQEGSAWELLPGASHPTLKVFQTH
ncbi:hypothetical protein [Harryflintia acetispora]|uniref:GLUG domain-containing protein n=1 Tax=Harryflintia acetispora TaxID=1849041 RepID=A0A9X8UI42_9FIRM|nr:hypothetical protein [Harryflintia acetispora]TCL42603.1 hypothetical protein EDD78_10970 [Harryflintia acetispora]